MAQQYILLAGFFVLHETFAATTSVFITMIAIMFSTLAMCMLPLFFSFIFRDIGKALAVPMVIFFLMIFLMNGDQVQLITSVLPMGQLRLISFQYQSLVGIHFITIDFLWIFILYLSAYFGFCHYDLK